MMSKDTNNISLLLDFFSRIVDKHGVKRKKIHEINTEFGEKRMFYLVKCQVLDGLSLLEFIDAENVRLSRQREELIDISVKIAHKNNNYKLAHSQEEVINHFKSGLPSGIGLRDMISQIKEHYPWSTSKKMIMIFLSLMTCILGVGLYILDLTTDLRFSLDMFNGFKSSKEPDFDEIWAEKGLNFSSLRLSNRVCYDYMRSSVSKEKNYRKLDPLSEELYVTTGWIAIYHCIQPFFITFLIFLSINCQKWKSCSKMIFKT